MINTLSRAVEEQFGINADPDNVKKLEAYLLETYGAINGELIKKVFSSGEAAGFLTVNETYFFREPAHFALLRDLLPSYAETGLHVCCAAVATGCEAYSLAMLIEAYNKGAEKPVYYHIDAFDLNPKVIETANQGVYGERALREDGSCFHYMANPYLKSADSGHRVDPVLRKNIRFFTHNLMDELPGKGYDIIFFRNALIYFTMQSRERVLSHLHAALREGGLLFVGVSETSRVQFAGLEGKNRNDVFYFGKSSQFTDA